MPPTITVLHVDDDGDLLDLVETYVEARYDDVMVATDTDPRAALERFRHGGSYDCIVSDYDMPVLDGLDLLAAVREVTDRLPFILFTGKGSEEIAAEAISRGVDDYMQKGPGTDQYDVLVSRIRSYVSKAQTERALEDSEARYRALVEQNVVGIYLIQNGEFVHVNPRLAEVFGYDQDEVVGMSPLVLTAEADRDLVAENIRKRVDGEVETIKYGFRGLRKDGGEFDLEVQGTRIELDGEPAVVGVLVED